MRKFSILAACLCFLLAGVAIALYASRPPTAPDMRLTLLSCTDIGMTNGFKTREATFDILNHSDGTVQLYSVAIEQRENVPPHLGFNPTVVRGATPTVMRSGATEKVRVRFTEFADGRPTEVRAHCTVIPGTPRNRWLDWLYRRTVLKVFSPKQTKPTSSSYSFSSKWTEN